MTESTQNIPNPSNPGVNTNPGGSDNMDRRGESPYQRSERGHRGCGWRFGGHGGERFSGRFGDGSGGRFGGRFGDGFGGRFGARLAERFGAGGRGGWHQPPVDIEEVSDAFILSLFASRLDKRGIGIGVNGDVLTIRYQSSESTQTSDESSRRYTRRESLSPDFVREFALNGKVNVDAIDASYVDGVLTVRLPKTPQAMQPEHKIVVS